MNEKEIREVVRVLRARADEYVAEYSKDGVLDEFCMGVVEGLAMAEFAFWDSILPKGLTGDDHVG